MQLIPMEALILEMDLAQSEKFKNLKFDDDSMNEHVNLVLEDMKKAVQYARFLRTSLTWEMFHGEGEASILTIENCSVLKPSNNETDVHLLIVPDEEAPFSLSSKATIGTLAGYPGAKLTEAGIKLIFG